MKSDQERLIAHAKCNGLPPEMFFEDAWFRAHISYKVALPAARAVCDQCQVRWECLAMEMAAEHSSADIHRAGVYAGFTTHQRYSLEKRGVPLNCPGCGEAFDPIQLRSGDLTCAFCDYAGVMEPIPDRGDDWAHRHTLLADAVLIWLVENVDQGELVPIPAKMARIVSARVTDLRRVYGALEDDQVLQRTTGGLVRQATAASTRGWIPPHMRIQTS